MRRNEPPGTSGLRKQLKGMLLILSYLKSIKIQGRDFLKRENYKSEKYEKKFSKIMGAREKCGR